MTDHEYITLRDAIDAYYRAADSPSGDAEHDAANELAAIVESLIVKQALGD